MKAKTLNLSSSLLTRTTAVGNSAFTFRVPVFMKLIHNGNNFEITEAYICTRKKIEEGTVAERLGFFNEIINKWYNADIEVEGLFIIANGYVSMINNPEYVSQLAQLRIDVANKKTRKQIKKETSKK